MDDVIYILVVVIFFAAAYGLVQFSGRITAPAEQEIEAEIALDAGAEEPR